MSERDALADRLDAVERALTDGDGDLTDLRDRAELAREVESLSDRLDDLEERADELDAAAQALRGYVGNVRAVNDDVERRADAALAKAESLEDELARAADAPRSVEHPDGRDRSGRSRGGRGRTSADSSDDRVGAAAGDANAASGDDSDAADERSGLLVRLAEAL